MGEMVKYSNKMNNIPLRNFNKRDLNFFYAVCSQVKDKGTNLVELSFDDIAKLSGYGDIEHPKRLREDLNEVRDKVLATQFHYETDEIDRKGNLFGTFDILKTRPKIKVRVNEDFVDFFNALVSEFTFFELEQYVSLNGVYTKNLFRLLKQWKSQGITNYGHPYSVEEIKLILGTPDYTPKHLMEKVIAPAVDEIKQKQTFQNLWCEVVYAKKRGRPVEGYIFHFSKESIPGQISFENAETFDAITDDMKPKKPRKPRAAKSNKFNNYEQRQAKTEGREKMYNELLEKKLLGVGLNAQEEMLFEILSAERSGLKAKEE